jgi:hypothetical protein
MTSSAKRRSTSLKSLICSCHSKWSCRLRGLVRFCSIGGSSSKPPRPPPGDVCSVRFSRNFSQSTSREAFSVVFASVVREKASGSSSLDG